MCRMVSLQVWKRRQERNPRAMLICLEEAPLVECVDGVRRLVRECMDPDDPDLRAVYGNRSVSAPAQETWHDLLLNATFLRTTVVCQHKLGTNVSGKVMENVAAFCLSVWQ